LPEGADVLISITDIHQKPESFPNPDEFDPERFSPERAALLDPSAFIPFSMGVRNCIGKLFKWNRFYLKLAMELFRNVISVELFCSEEYCSNSSESGAVPFAAWI
jgi:cytochrome P450